MKALLPLLAVVGSLSVLPAAQEATFRAQTNLVRVDVLASNGRQPITDLTLADFDVRDQGTSQKVDFMRFEELPLNVVVVCDLSLSVAGDDAANIKRAVRSLLPNLRQGDRVSLITFGGRVSERLKLTEDVASLVNALEAVTPSGNDATDRCHLRRDHARSERNRVAPSVLVFSDGIDTASWLRPDQLLEAVKASPATVYAASVGDGVHGTVAGGHRHLRAGATPRLHPPAISSRSSRNFSGSFANVTCSASSQRAPPGLASPRDQGAPARCSGQGAAGLRRTSLTAAEQVATGPVLR